MAVSVACMHASANTVAAAESKKFPFVVIGLLYEEAWIIAALISVLGARVWCSIISEVSPKSRVLKRLLWRMTSVYTRKCFPASAFRDPSAKPSHHSNHLQPRGRAFFESRSGEYPLCLTVSQSVLRIHQIIIAYSKLVVQPYSTGCTKLH